MISRLFYILFLSGFNTLYKYLSVEESVSSYGNGFMGKYMTISNYEISYFNVFLNSILLLFIVDFIIFIVMHFKDKKIYLEVFDSGLIILFIIISACLLFVNITLSLIFLLIGFIVYFLKKYKKVNFFYFMFSLICFIVSVIGLWFISY